MKKVLKGVCILLVLSTLLSTTVFAAKEETASTYSYYFHSCSAYCYPTGGTQFEVWFDILAKDDMDIIGVEKVKIQKSSDGKNWLTVMTYLSSYYDHLLKTNTDYYSGHVTYTGAAGFYYRAYITFYAKKDSGIAKHNTYTQTIYLNG